MAFKVKMKNMADVSIKRVVVKLIATIITLWVGGTILNEVGDVLVGECSPFFQGVTLLGWNLTTATNETTDASWQTTNTHNSECIWNTNTIDDTTGVGVLSVIGIIGLAAIVLEFVQFRF